MKMGKKIPVFVFWVLSVGFMGCGQHIAEAGIVLDSATAKPVGNVFVSEIHPTAIAMVGNLDSNTENPTGTYEFQSKGSAINENIDGCTGEVRVHMISKNKIIVWLAINKGAPSYNSGEAFDTVAYRFNRAMYTTGDDPSCRISFRFFPDKVEVKETTADYNSGCGFGHAVVADGVYEKISGLVPNMVKPN